MTLREHIKTIIQRALVEHGGNVSDAARTLGINRSTIDRYLSIEERALAGTKLGAPVKRTA